MSNKVKKLAENAKEYEEVEELVMYTTLLGTIIASVGILNGVDYHGQLQCLKELMRSSSDELPNTVIGLVNYVWDKLGKDENKPLRANLVLITDDEEVRSPMVSIIKDEEVMPLSPNGLAYGVIGLAREARPNIDVEYLYDEDGEDYTDEE